MNLHSHNGFEINYIQRGNCLYTIGSKQLPLHKGNICILNANVPHKVFISDPKSHIVSMEVDLSLYDDPFLFENNAAFKMVRGKEIIVKLLQIISDVLYIEDSGSYIRHCIDFLVEFIKYERKNRYVIQTKQFISENYSRINHIKDVSKHLNISDVHLQRVFKKDAGISIGAYINQVKVDNAAYLLRNTDIPIGKIDAMTGFNSRQSFYRCFRRVFQMSPLEYRRSNQKNQAHRGRARL